jgi:hypothetical protein
MPSMLHTKSVGPSPAFVDRRGGRQRGAHQRSASAHVSMRSWVVPSAGEEAHGGRPSGGLLGASGSTGAHGRLIRVRRGDGAEVGVELGGGKGLSASCLRTVKSGSMGIAASVPPPSATMAGVTIPGEYGFVLLVLVASWLLNYYLALQVILARRRYRVSSHARLIFATGWVARPRARPNVRASASHLRFSRTPDGGHR